MNVEFTSRKNMTLNTFVAIEKETSLYLSERIALLERKGTLKDVTPLTLHVSVQSAKQPTKTSSTINLVNSTVSLVYQSTQDKPLILEQVMDLALLQGFETFNFSFASEIKSITFDPLLNDTTILNVMGYDDFDDSSSTNRALIWATSILSIMLVVVSILLLIVSGSWISCKNFCVNCLFEDDDDDFELKNKDTMMVGTGLDEDGDDEDAEEVDRQSAVSPAPTNASGYLGAQVESNLLAGLGIKAPGQQDGGSVMSYDDEVYDGITPRSEVSNSLPLGITSIRKMPETESPDAQRTLTGIIMQRFAGTSGKNALNKYSN